MAPINYGKIIDITLAVAGIAIPLITKARNDKKAEAEMVKKFSEIASEEVAKQLANRRK